MGMEVKMQHGDNDIKMGVEDILEHKRICLERQSRIDAQLLLQYQDPGVPEPEEVMDTQPGEGVEEDCTVGYQGGTWWLGRWMMKDNTENNSSTHNPSTNVVGSGKNKREQSHNQLISKCITKTTSN